MCLLGTCRVLAQSTISDCPKSTITLSKNQNYTVILQHGCNYTFKPENSVGVKAALRSSYLSPEKFNNSNVRVRIDGPYFISTISLTDPQVAATGVSLPTANFSVLVSPDSFCAALNLSLNAFDVKTACVPSTLVVHRFDDVGYSKFVSSQDVVDPCANHNISTTFPMQIRASSAKTLTPSQATAPKIYVGDQFACNLFDLLPASNTSPYNVVAPQNLTNVLLYDINTEGVSFHFSPPYDLSGQVSFQSMPYADTVGTSKFVVDSRLQPSIVHVVNYRRYEGGSLLTVEAITPDSVLVVYAQCVVKHLESNVVARIDSSSRANYQLQLRADCFTLLLTNGTANVTLNAVQRDAATSTTIGRSKTSSLMSYNYGLPYSGPEGVSVSTTNSDGQRRMFEYTIKDADVGNNTCLSVFVRDGSTAKNNVICDLSRNTFREWGESLTVQAKLRSGSRGFLVAVYSNAGSLKLFVPELLVYIFAVLIQSR